MKGFNKNDVVVVLTNKGKTPGLDVSFCVEGAIGLVIGSDSVWTHILVDTDHGIIPQLMNNYQIKKIGRL